MSHIDCPPHIDGEPSFMSGSPVRVIKETYHTILHDVDPNALPTAAFWLPMQATCHPSSPLMKNLSEIFYKHYDIISNPCFSDRELFRFQNFVSRDERLVKILKAALLKHDSPNATLPKYEWELSSQITDVLENFFAKNKEYVKVSRLALSGEIYKPKNKTQSTQQSPEIER